MSDTEATTQSRKRSPFRVRLPGFVVAEDVGLGQAVKRVTSTAGIHPCGGCTRRAAALDRRVVFTRWHRSRG